MKHNYIKYFLLALLALISLGARAQNIGDFRSVATGDWNSTSTWNTYDGATWVTATSTPTSTSVVYLEPAFTVSLSQDESVLDLHINGDEDVDRLTLGDNTLTLHGEMSDYSLDFENMTPLPGAPPSGSTRIITNGPIGRIKLVGSVDRHVVIDNTITANRRYNYRMEFAFDEGVTGSFNESIRVGELIVTSGIFNMDNTGDPDKLFVDASGDNGIIDGDLIVKSGAKLICSHGIFKANTAPANSLIVEDGATLELGWISSAIAFADIDFSGKLAFNSLGSAQTFPLSTSDGKIRPGTNELDSASIVSFMGSDVITLAMDFYVEDSLIVNSAAPFNNSTFDLNFASTGILQFENNAKYISSGYYSTLLPDKTIVNSLALNLQNDITIESELELNGLLFLGSNNLIMGENSGDILGGLSNASMIVTQGSGEVRKIFSAAGSFTFPLGDTVGVDEYSPVNFTLNSGTGLSSSTYVGFSVSNSAHLAVNDGNYLNRIWKVNTDITDLNYSLGALYTDDDVVGDESKLNEYIFASLAGSSASKAYGPVSSGSNKINLMNVVDLGSYITASGRCSIADNDLTKPVDTSFCFEGTPATIVGSVPTTTTGNYSFVWEQSINSANFSEISGETGQNYAEANLLSVGLYKYRRLTLDSLGCGTSVIDTSNVIEVIVSDSVRVNTISEANSRTEFCGALEADIEGSIPSGGSGFGFSYAWDERFNGGVFTTISGADQIDYMTAAETVTGTYEYRRVVTSGECPSGISDTISLVLNDSLKAGSIGSDQTIVENTTPNTLTETGVASGGGATIAYQWMDSEDKFSTFIDISGAENITYSPGALSATTFYLRKVISGECVSYSSDTLEITVTPNVGVFDVVNSKSFEVYPNPANNSLTIVLDGDIASVNVSSATAGLAEAFEAKGAELDISSLESGIYIIEVVTDKGNYISRFVKN